MGRFFNLDSPVMVALTKMADLIIVNLLAFFCCLPIITVGASMTALHYVALKIVRDEECYIVKGFFKSLEEENIDIKNKNITILGTGGASISIISQAVFEGINNIFVFKRDKNWDEQKKILDNSVNI